MMKFIFGMQMNIKIFYKWVLRFWACIARHAQSSQNNKFAISLQYVQKEMSDEVYFLHEDKHQNFLQIDTMIFDGDGQEFLKFPK